MTVEAPARAARAGRASPATLPVSSIRVGRRFRKDLGDLDSLKASIVHLGLLHPVVVDEKSALIAGFRRIRACEALGWSEVPVRVVPLDGDGVLFAQRDENTAREDFPPEDLVAIGRAIEEREAEAARQRQAAAGPAEGKGAKRTGSGKLPEAVRGRAADRAAAAGGVSRRTYEKAKAVVEAAEEDPKRFGPVAEEMNRTRNVHGAFEVLRGRRTLESLKSSTSVEWYTPPEYLDLVREVLGEIDLDPASSEVANRAVKAKRFFTAAADGLMHPWTGRVFCNPPYGGAQAAFAARLLEEHGEDHVREAVLLLNANAVETEWFRPLWGHTLCFVYGRINFLSPSTTKTSSTHGSVFVYLGASWRRFAEVFSRVGAVVRKVTP